MLYGRKNWQAEFSLRIGLPSLKLGKLQWHCKIETCIYKIVAKLPVIWYLGSYHIGQFIDRENIDG